MTIEELIEKLKSCNTGDSERDHGQADDYLLEYIGNEEVSKIYNAIEKWYA